jgi:hypothetical protein
MAVVVVVLGGEGDALNQISEFYQDNRGHLGSLAVSKVQIGAIAKSAPLVVSYKVVLSPDTSPLRG